MNSSTATLTPTHPRRSNAKSLTEIKTTPVILVCIYNRGNTLITHDLLYQLFSAHGQVLKILIFEKTNVWKAFIEFSTAHSASQAKRNLDDTVILDDGGKVSIYLSNLKTIKFQNNNPGGKDYAKKTQESKAFDIETIEDDYNDIFPSVLKSEVSNMDLGEFSSKHKPTTAGRQNQANAHDNEPKEDEIMNIVKSFEEKLISNEDEDSKPDFDDLEKDDLFSLITSAFQQKNLKAKSPSNDEPDSYDIPFDSLSRVFDSSSSRFPSVQDFNQPPCQEFNKPGSLSKWSTLSEIPDDTQAIKHPLSRMMSFDDVMIQPRSLQRHKTSIELDMPCQSSFGNGDSYFKFPTVHQQNLTKHASSQALEFFEGKSYGNTKTHTKNEHHYLKGTNKIRAFHPLEKSDENNPLLMNAGPLGMKKESSSNMFEDQDEKKSQVLYVKGLHHQDIKVHMIYNIFSNFGNLLRIIFIRNKAVALLEYENEEYSTVAKEYLNNIIFMGSALRICYSNYSMINLSNKRSSTEAEEVFRGTPKTFRFKRNGNVSINPPSPTLHLSNLTRDACNESLIRTYFSQYARIESLRFLHVDNMKNMCLLKLGSIEESMNALAHLHDTSFCGRNIQISFSRSKF